MATYRVVSLTKNGHVSHKDHKSRSNLLRSYEQIGVEEDSYTVRLHGEPILKGLIGPMSESKTIVRYETPQVFAMLTEQWSKSRRASRRRRSS